MAPFTIDTGSVPNDKRFQDAKSVSAGPVRPKRVALKEGGYYSNCTLVEMTPFDIAILFGKLRPVTDSNGQGSLVEMYERQVYLSHRQARALYEGLGRSLGSLSRMGRQAGIQEAKPEGRTEEE